MASLQEHRLDEKPKASREDGTSPEGQLSIGQHETGPERSGARGIFHDFGVVAVAVCALVGAVFVNDDRFVSNEPGLRVALYARDVGVAAG